MEPHNLKEGLDFIDEERQGASQVTTLGRQLFLGRWKVLTVSYTDALSVGPYSYLIVDASPHSEIVPFQDELDF
jgi:hypothetical protein